LTVSGVIDGMIAVLVVAEFATIAWSVFAGEIHRRRTTTLDIK